MKRIKQVLISLAFVVGLSTAIVPASPVAAINVFEGCKGNNSSEVCSGRSQEQANDIVKPVVNTLLYILGAIAVIMIIIGGFRYTLSGGDNTGVAAAKNTILYSVIGLVVAILAWAIVNFVIGIF